MKFNRAALIVFDGVGCGEARDTASRYPTDVGANSLHWASTVRMIDAPHLQGMGLEHIPGLEELDTKSVITRDQVHGAFAALEPTFAGNGSPEGHQALMGHIVYNPYRTFDKERILPEIKALIQEAASSITGRRTQVIVHPETDDISGTTFIEHPEIGPVHLRSRDLAEPLYVPVYASSDSVLQLALHREVAPQIQVERIGKEVRQRLNEGGHRIGRVIMRPFSGELGNFKRDSSGRRDYGVDPDQPTLIDHLTANQTPVFGIGKAGSMFHDRGFPEGNSRKLKTDVERIEEVRKFFESSLKGFLFANLVDTDEQYGHRRDPEGYVRYMNGVDRVIGEILKKMKRGDLLFISSDHGNDPTQRKHTNHTRERVPLLVAGPDITGPIELGIRDTYADVGQTLAEIFRLPPGLIRHGSSFLSQIS